MDEKIYGTAGVKNFEAFEILSKRTMFLIKWLLAKRFLIELIFIPAHQVKFLIRQPFQKNGSLYL